MNIFKRIIYQHFVPLYGKALRSHNRYINVIYYHDIVNSGGAGAQYTNIDIFKRQMEYIVANGYATYTFDELSDTDKLAFNKKSVLITFDDGWVSNFNEIFEFMKSKGIKYNIFLTVGKIGNDPDYLTWEQVREMHKSSLVGFGAHTYSHVSLKDISSVDTELEIVKADEVIERETGIGVLDFCSPYGQHSAESDEYLLNNTAYRRIYTSAMKFSYNSGERIIFGRSSINNDEPFGVFKNKLRGNYNAFAMI